jgi:hypothetical protein
MNQDAVALDWHCFDRLTTGRAAFATTPCVYAQTDRQRRVIRVGKAGGGLGARYRGGTGYTIDAAMHESGNLVFVAAVPADLVEAVEATLIWENRDGLIYNNIGRKRQLVEAVAVIHRGDTPRFD